MAQATLPELAGWGNFCEVVGSAAGALTGLQFIVITLLASLRRMGSMQEVRAFGTPTVVHFCAALLIAALLSAPWPTLSHLAVCLVTCGVLGLAYAIRVLWHARKAEYNPDAEDWVWYAALPLLTYAVLVAAGTQLWWHPIASLFAIAATAVSFLFIGIHNSWDTVTYIAVHQREQHKEETSPPES